MQGYTKQFASEEDRDYFPCYNFRTRPIIWFFLNTGHIFLLSIMKCSALRRNRTNRLMCLKYQSYKSKCKSRGSHLKAWPLFLCASFSKWPISTIWSQALPFEKLVTELPSSSVGPGFLLEWGKREWINFQKQFSEEGQALIPLNLL